MHAGPITTFLVSAALVVGVGEGTEKLAPHRGPIIELVAVGIDGENVIYERRVHSDDVIRAPYFSDMVNVETERSVAACETSGRADYGPGEPEVQTWHLDRFFAPGCMAALEPGVTYSIVATVTPIEGPASVIRSDPFEWNP